MTWKSTSKSSSKAKTCPDESSGLALGVTNPTRELRIDRTGALRISTGDYEVSESTRMVELRELEKVIEKTIVLEEKTAILEEKMKHMEETFAKTVQDLVESLTKEHDERTTDKAALDDIPF